MRYTSAGRRRKGNLLTNRRSNSRSLKDIAQIEPLSASLTLSHVRPAVQEKNAMRFSTGCGNFQVKPQRPRFHDQSACWTSLVRNERPNGAPLCNDAQPFVRADCREAALLGSLASLGSRSTQTTRASPSSASVLKFYRFISVFRSIRHSPAKAA